MTEIRTRIAPSPTGFAHVGTLRSALFNFLFAKKYQGKFILRIEDTDRNRFVPGAIEDVVKVLHDFKLSPDEGFVWKAGKVEETGSSGPYLQSKRLEIYQKYATELIEKGRAYYCFCSTERVEELRKSQEAQRLAPRYDKHCLSLTNEEIIEKLASKVSHVVRLNVPSGETVNFVDLIHGAINISTNEVDDQVLMKSDGFPTYHLAVVVDDHLMGITHVLRGDEWLPSTPKHILLYSAFGWTLPQYGHLPLLLSTTRKKLSKREGDVSVKDFVAQGYLPEALINFIAFLGWSPKTEQEIFSLEELIQEFDLSKVNKAGAIFDLDKLDWFNGMYIRKMDPEDLYIQIRPFLISATIQPDKYPKEFIIKILKLECDRLKKLSEIGERVQYFFKQPIYDPNLLVWKKGTKDSAYTSLELLKVFLSQLDPDELSKENLEPRLKEFIVQKNLSNGEVLWPLRVALSGLNASPSPFEIIDALVLLENGEDEVVSRIHHAIDLLT